MSQEHTTVLHESATPGFVYGTGAAMQTLNEMVAEIARTDIPVLIVGESGTGKDAYAKLIHKLSVMSHSRLKKINCASFDPVELFGQLRSSTPSSSAPDACGTFYLDNVQELDAASQRELISHLPDGERPDSREQPIVRFISSTAGNLESEVEAGSFRRELYFRLNGVCLRLPPLRERKEDIPALLDHFLGKHSALLGKAATHITDRALQTLSAYHWPGNIRELENLARKLVVFGDIQIALNDLQAAAFAPHAPAGPAQGGSLKVAARAASKKAERELIMQALERTRWNRKRAARDLQISYKSLLYKIKQIGVSNGKHES
ncbi:MAG TPA: sigma 54-interacting transcriptional regulator [Candidatus Acidoferrum sp.]|nr:sigma 54-interacting transcriptional regulator [Candidatus Acidoferrum sp.]